MLPCSSLKTKGQRWQFELVLPRSFNYGSASGTAFWSPVTYEEGRFFFNKLAIKCVYVNVKKKTKKKHYNYVFKTKEVRWNKMTRTGSKQDARRNCSWCGVKSSIWPFSWLSPLAFPSSYMACFWNWSWIAYYEVICWISGFTYLWRVPVRRDFLNVLSEGLLPLQREPLWH